jgi:hypothetical protein
MTTTYGASDDSIPPVWLLDVDGVVNAISRKPDRSVWPADQWITGTANADGTDWPILAARPVIDFIRQVHGSGRAEVRWHTTWQRDAANLAKLLDLPEFEVQDCPEFATRRQSLGGLSPTAVRAAWWKLPAAERVVGGEGRALVWTDDDAAWPVMPREAAADLARCAPTLIVTPQTHLGLTGKHLRKISDFLDEVST